MKYLKSYTLFESSEESFEYIFPDVIIDNIIDIISELDFNDISYKVKYTNNYLDSEQSDNSYRAVKIYLKDKYGRFFTYPDIKEVLLRLRDYLVGFKIDIEYEGEFQSIDEFIDLYGSEEFYSLNIIIYK